MLTSRGRCLTINIIMCRKLLTDVKMPHFLLSGQLLKSIPFTPYVFVNKKGNTLMMLI